MTDLPSDQPIAPAPANAPVVPPVAVAASIVAPPAPIVTLDTSAARGVLTSLITAGVRIAGTALMAHGAMTQAQANSIEPIIVQEIVGTALVVGGQAWAMAREWLSHQKLWKAAFADPSLIVVKGS